MGTHPTKIAMVITSLLNVAALSVANANDEMVNLAALSDVITVTGSRFERTADQQLTLINTIEREDIAKLNPKSIADVLETLPGVSVARNGGAGQNTSISIRGSNSNHVLVLIDGIKVGSATLGAVSFNTLSPENIERIEVLKGPRASVWGSDAIGGVIQIFTRQLSGGEMFAGAEYGTDAYWRGSAGIGINHGDGSSSITLNHEQTEGYDVYQGAPSENDEDGFHRNSVAIKGTQTLSAQWQALWVAQYDKGNTQFDDVYASGSFDEADYANYLWDLGAHYTAGKFTSQFSLGQSLDYNENFRGDNADLPSADYETRRDQLHWANQYQVYDGLVVSGGVDWANETVNGEFAQDERDLLGVYGLVQKQWDQLLIEAVLRYDDVENIDSEVSYNLSAAYQFNEQWRLTATTGTAFKAPTFNDLYWPSLGNPNLVSETSENYDLTLHFDSPEFSAYVSLFENNIDNLIAWAPTGEKDDYGWDIWKPANINEAQIRGAEFSASYQLLQLQHQLNYTYLQAENKQTAEPLAGRSEHELNYSASYEWTVFDLLLNYHYQGKRSAGFNPDLASYHKVDLSLGYHLNDAWQLRVKANNLFDEEVVSAQNYVSSGREWFISVSYKTF